MTWEDLLDRIFRLRSEVLRSSEFHAVDKRIPVPPGMYKNPANGINSLWNGAGVFFHQQHASLGIYLYNVMHPEWWLPSKSTKKPRNSYPLNVDLKIEPKQNILRLTHILQGIESILKKVQERQVHHIEHGSSLKPKNAKKASTIGDNSNELLYSVRYLFSMVHTQNAFTISAHTCTV